MKAVVAIDSMKGCLTSKEAGTAFAEGLKDRWPEMEVKVLPVADGGEGTADCIAGYSEGYLRIQSVACGPEGKPVKAGWWMNQSEKIACIDMAAAAGLPLVGIDSRNPMKTTTYGVGQLLDEARKQGAEKIILGLGGSATVDGGMGALQALGAKLTDKTGDDLPVPFVGAMLSDIADINTEGMSPEWKDTELILACDVTTRFTGENGAARIFAPQKGASPEETEFLDAGLVNLKDIIKRKKGTDLDTLAGSGAAGGCGGGLMAILGGRIATGADLVLDAAGFDSLIEDADFVVTGEGKADSQTLMHKLPGAILDRCKKAGVKAVIIAGKIEDRNLLSEAGFAEVIDINNPQTVSISGTEGCQPLDRNIATRRLTATGKMCGFFA